MRDEWRRIQRAVVRVARGATERQPRAGARAGDVAVVPLVSELHEFARIENDADGFELVAVSLGQQGGCSRRGWEDRLIHAEHKSELQFGIARAVDGADQHLIERGWNHADGQAPQARFQNRQPFAQ